MMDELTAREKDAAELVVQGHRNKAIAEHMGIKESAVRQYLHRVYEKVGVDSRVQLAIVLTKNHIGNIRY